jgi:hypothetical protein
VLISQKLCLIKQYCQAPHNQANLFLNISTAVEIEKTDKTLIYRGGYVANRLKIEFVVVSWSFMAIVFLL